jgi:hypothetical protein
LNKNLKKKELQWLQQQKRKKNLLRLKSQTQDQPQVQSANPTDRPTAVLQAARKAAARQETTLPVLLSAAMETQLKLPSAQVQASSADLRTYGEADVLKLISTTVVSTAHHSYAGLMHQQP